MDLRLKGKRAIVTGGTRGIGRRIVDLLVAEGCDVGFCARDKTQVDEVVAVLSGTAGTVIGGAVDVADGDGLRTWVTATAETLAAMTSSTPPRRVPWSTSPDPSAAMRRRATASALTSMARPTPVP